MKRRKYKYVEGWQIVSLVDYSRLYYRQASVRSDAVLGLTKGGNFHKYR